mgnify:CR=1 FL=1
MSRPVVGLSTYLEPARWGVWNMEAALIPRWYLDVLNAAGADVLLFPPGSSAASLGRVDGLVIAGGADVDARRYGELPHETTDAARESRDATELSLYDEARSRDLPTLGICRGAQLMAVAHGGVLHQHLPEITNLEHRAAPAVFAEHEVTFSAGSRIADIYRTTNLVVNSYHHQAIKSSGDLEVSGLASDGTVEVVEDPTAAFAVGVQWHPEHPDRRNADRPLMESFVRACS